MHLNQIVKIQQNNITILYYYTSIAIGKVLAFCKIAKRQPLQHFYSINRFQIDNDKNLDTEIR